MDGAREKVPDGEDDGVFELRTEPVAVREAVVVFETEGEDVTVLERAGDADAAGEDVGVLVGGLRRGVTRGAGLSGAGRWGGRSATPTRTHLLGAMDGVAGCVTTAVPVAGAVPLAAAERRAEKDLSAERVDVLVAVEEDETSAGAALSARGSGAAARAVDAERRRRRTRAARPPAPVMRGRASATPMQRVEEFNNNQQESKKKLSCVCCLKNFVFRVALFPTRWLYRQDAAVVVKKLKLQIKISVEPRPERVSASPLASPRLAPARRAARPARARRPPLPPAASDRAYPAVVAPTLSRTQTPGVLASDPHFFLLPLLSAANPVSAPSSPFHWQLGAASGFTPGAAAQAFLIHISYSI